MTTTTCPCGHPFREHDLGASVGIGRREVACIHCGCGFVVSELLNEAIDSEDGEIAAVAELERDRRVAAEALRDAAGEAERLARALPPSWQPADASVPDWLRDRADLIERGAP